MRGETSAEYTARVMVEVARLARDFDTSDLRAKADARRGGSLPPPNVSIDRATIDRALTIARDTYGPQSQAAFAIEAILKACEG